MKLLNKSLFLKTAIVFVLAINVLVVFYIKKQLFPRFEKQPLISVVVTSYNYEKFIKETLNSILKQSYKNYEVVIVDDGSKDNSIEVIKQYTDKYKNFYLYTHEGAKNKGFVESMRLGISKAKGDYVAFLESDDYWHKDNLLEKVKLINKYDYAFFISNSISVFGDKEIVKIREDYVRRVDEVLFREKTIIHPLRLEEFNPVPTLSSVMIKKEILDKLDYNTVVPEFLDYWLYRQILLFNPIYHVKKKLTFWRQHSNSYFTKEAKKHNSMRLKEFLGASNGLLFSGKIRLKKYTPF